MAPSFLEVSGLGCKMWLMNLCGSVYSLDCLECIQVKSLYVYAMVLQEESNC